MMDWRNRLYEEYVVSGQAAGDGKAAFEQSSIATRRDGIQNTIRRFMPKEKGLRIVDLGCGHGDYVYHLNERGYKDVQGVDVSKEQVELAHELGVKNVVHDSILSYLQEQEPGSIDVVLLIDVLEHLPRQKLFEVMDSAVRAMASGGRCLVHVPNALGLFGERVRYGDLTHERAFTPNSIQQLFHTVGLSDVTCHEDPPGGRFRRPLWFLSILPFRGLLWLEKPDETSVLSQNMYVTASKT
jgi:SAM-dependent methyltransferase